MAKEGKKKGRKKAVAKKASAPKRKSLPLVKESISTKNKIVLSIVFAFLAMLIYAPSHNFGFVYDDDAVVKDNKYVHEGLGGLEKIWTTTYFKGYDENINARAYRPIPLTTLALEHEIWGLDSSINHKTNILFYGLTGVFLFLFLAKLLRKHHPLFPIVATLLFLVHPIHIEVVGNIKSRDTMLGFLNLVVALWLLLKYIDSRKLTHLLLSFLFYSIALLSKEEVITAVATIPVMLWCFRKLNTGKIAAISLPFLALASIFIAVRFAIIGGVDAGVTLTKLDNSLLAASGFAERSASNILVIGHYLLKAVWPHPLISDYSFSTIPLTNWADWRVYLSLITNIGLFVFSILGIRKRRAWGYALFWYFSSVSIFTSIVTTNVSAYNDRFLYSPVLGICLFAAWGISRLAVKSEERNILDFTRKNVLALSLAAIISIAALYKVESHLPLWKDRFALFEHDAELTPNNARTRKNHGGSLARKALEFQSSDSQKMREYANAAIVELEASLAIYPNIPTGHIHVGNMHILLKQYEKAVDAFTEALRQAPQNYFAKSSLAIAYYHQGKYQDALKIIEGIPVQLRRASDKQMIQRCQSMLK